MQIDAREIETKDVLKKLKTIMESQCGELDIQILLSEMAEAKKVHAFVSMAGCKTDIDKKEDYYIMRVWGNPCCI